MHDEMDYRVWHPERKALYPVESIKWRYTFVPAKGRWETYMEIKCAGAYGLVFLEGVHKEQYLMRRLDIRDSKGRYMYEGDIYITTRQKGKRESENMCVARYNKKKLRYPQNLVQKGTKVRVIGNVFEDRHLLNATKI